ncbi:MAG TPA: PAS domain S-box protein, partial [Planctomycetota bacterium]|nr:PAS domain S-box protein [Planctomycetota bacterium]
MQDRGGRPPEWFASAFYASPVPLSISTLEGARLIDVNDSFVRVFGYPREEILGRSSLEVGLWAKPEERAACADRVRREGVLRNVEIAVRRKSGEVFPVLVSVDLVPLGEEPCVIATYQDMSEIRRLEAQFLSSQKMGALGRLAGGVAHDFNNLLTAILAHCGLGLADLPTGDPRGRHLEGIRKTADRAAALTRQLLAFSRRQPMQADAIDLRALVADMEGLLRQLIGEDIRLETELDPSVGPIRADRSQMEQVILNLAVNARDSMPTGGRLVIEASNADLPTASARSANGRFVRLALRDTGCGMDRETMSHLFEPFFTTKPK